MIRYASPISTPPRTAMNTGLSPATNATWLQAFGAPRGRATRDCAEVTNPKLLKEITTRRITPNIHATGLIKALDSLEEIFAEVKLHNIELWAATQTAGMLCCRVVRGTRSTWSNHAFGGAIDLYFGSEIDSMGDSQTQLGLRMLYPFFHMHRWFWGAGYRTREDSMHFEISNELIQEWYL